MVETVIIKLTQNNGISVSNLESNNPGYDYIIFDLLLSNTDETNTIDLTINDVRVDLPKNFNFNYIPINNVHLHSNSECIVFIKKQKKIIFGDFLVPQIETNTNSFVDDYVDNYFE